MSQFPSLKSKEVIKILERNGFKAKRQRGSHITFYNSRLDATVSVPFHLKDIKKGTLLSIVKQSKLDKKEFFKKK